MHPKQQTGDSTASESETGIRHGKSCPDSLFPVKPDLPAVGSTGFLCCTLLFPNYPELLLWVSAPVTKYTLTKMHFHVLFPSIILSSPSSPETS